MEIERSFTDQGKTRPERHGMGSCSLELRDYQTTSIEKTFSLLQKKGNALCVAPTGSGKTVILSKLIEKFLRPEDKNGRPKKQRVLVIQHTKELLQQNQNKFETWCKGISTSLFHGEEKSLAGTVVFGMIQALTRNIKKLPKFDLIVIDEAHHSIAKSYERVIDSLRSKNPDLKLLGMTATPARGDKRSIRKKWFDGGTVTNHLSDLIEQQFLVAPRVFAIDAGQKKSLKELLWRKNNRGRDVFLNKQKDWDAANFVLTDNELLDGEVVRNWKEKAYGKKTVVFCSIIDHAMAISDVFNRHGIKAVHINGSMSVEDREAALRSFESSDPDSSTVITNAAVLTEGWDYPPTECIILLRPMSRRTTYIQMVGRGLRPSPGKTECTVLDFGLSSQIHKIFETEEEKEIKERERQEKEKREQEEKEKILVAESKPPAKYAAPVFLRELDLFSQSSYVWVSFGPDVTGTEIHVAGGYDAAVFIIKKPDGHCTAILRHEDNVDHIAQGSPQSVLLACERHMRDLAFWRKEYDWMTKPPSEKQVKFLGGSAPETCYEASLLISLNIHRNQIQQLADCRIAL